MRARKARIRNARKRLFESIRKWHERHPKGVCLEGDAVMEMRSGRCRLEILKKRAACYKVRFETFTDMGWAVNDIRIPEVILIVETWEEYRRDVRKYGIFQY